MRGGMDKMVYSVEQARGLKKISQEKMAELLKMSKNGYINKEKGNTRFYIDEAIRFCKIVEMSLDDINFFIHDVP